MVRTTQAAGFWTLCCVSTSNRKVISLNPGVAKEVLATPFFLKRDTVFVLRKAIGVVN
jgi:hypothetical protein